VATATTVVQAVREAVAHAGMTLTGASVAVEGFGRVGRHIATRLAALGARIVAASVREGAVHAPDGLRLDDDAWLSGGAGRRIPRAELLALPVDVLVPCARSWTIDADNADDVAAHVIVPGANTPLTAEAERALVGRGVTVVPDFVANCGGILYPHMRYRGFGFDVFARVVETALAERMRGVLAKAQAEGKRPSEVAERIAWRNFDRHAELLRELPDRAAARQLVLVRRHGIRAFPARVAGELHARVPNLSRAVGSAALQRYLAATLAADGE
jgi:glutamate dehydrogenase (NAD(P)+)